MTTIGLQAWTWRENEGGFLAGARVKNASAPRRLLGSHQPVLGPLDPLVRDVHGPPAILQPAEAGLPEGMARAEFVAAGLRRAGVAMTWEEDQPQASVSEPEKIFHQHGRSSVHMARADPSLLAYVQLGSWFNAGWKLRILRRLLVSAPGAGFLKRLLPRRGTGQRLRADLAFWSGVRDESTRHEWRRFTLSSFVVLTYHRLAGEHRPGQEQLDLAPRRFAMQMRLLDLLRYRPLSIEDVVRFTGDPEAVLARRSYLATFDDAFQDNAEPLQRYARRGLVMFAPTGTMGGSAVWAGDEPVLSWDELKGLENAGIEIGSHTRFHSRLSDLATKDQDDELRGSRRDLDANLSHPAAAVAYPHGDHDEAVIRRAADAGFSAGFVTLPGLNGAGTHPLCLRRVGIWAQDGPFRFCWKLITGEYAPAQARTGGRKLFTLVRQAAQRDHPTSGRGAS